MLVNIIYQEYIIVINFCAPKNSIEMYKGKIHRITGRQGQIHNYSGRLQHISFNDKPRISS